MTARDPRFAAALAKAVRGEVKQAASLARYSTYRIGGPATVFLPAVAMVVLTHFVGLYVSGALYLAAYMRLIGRHRWVTTVLIAIAIPVVAFLIFEVWFLVPLPKGPLEARLGY